MSAEHTNIFIHKLKTVRNALYHIWCKTNHYIVYHTKYWTYQNFSLTLSPSRFFSLSFLLPLVSEVDGTNQKLGWRLGETSSQFFWFWWRVGWFVEFGGEFGGWWALKLAAMAWRLEVGGWLEVEVGLVIVVLAVMNGVFLWRMSEAEAGKSAAAARVGGCGYSFDPTFCYFVI